MGLMRVVICILMVSLFQSGCGKKKKKGGGNGFNVALLETDPTTPAIYGGRSASFPVCSTAIESKSGYDTLEKKLFYCNGKEWVDTGIVGVSTYEVSGKGSNLCDLADAECKFESATVEVLAGEHFFVQTSGLVSGERFNISISLSKFSISTTTPAVRLLGFTRAGKPTVFLLFDKAAASARIVWDEDEDGVIKGDEPVLENLSVSGP